MQQQQENTSLWFGPEQTSRACLLIHGFSGSPQELLGLAQTLAAQEMRVYCLSLPGHTGNPEDLLKKGYVSRSLLLLSSSYLQTLAVASWQNYAHL